MDCFNKRVSGRLGNVEAQFVVEGALIKVSIISLEVWKGNSFCIQGGKSINDELVRGGRLGDFSGGHGIKHVNLEVGEKNLERVILQGVHDVFAGKGVSRTHSGSRGVVPNEVIVL